MAESVLDIRVVVPLRNRGASYDLIHHVTDRPGHDRRYALDAGKIRYELGWRSSRDFDEVVVAAVCWYLDHRGWADAIRRGEYMEFHQRQYGDR